MTHIEFFKLQAKNLFKDYKTKTSVFDKELNVYYYEYTPQYFDVAAIFLDYDVDEDNFTLMNAQHLIAKIAGFFKWNDMVNANDHELELAKLLFDNQHKVSADDWHMYLNMTQRDNKVIFDSETRLEIFTMVFVNQEGHDPLFQDYRL
ncbi:MAG: hypothetical protein GXC78_10245 [Chitinophagaceae bacterium]|nr:hypothetical protein [Chitinophagaceae bacterium]